MDIDGTRRGEIFFARTTVVLGQIGTRTTIHGVAIVDGWVMAYGWRTCGRNIFRPYIRGAASGVEMVMVMVGRLRINATRAGKKDFAPTWCVWI